MSNQSGHTTDANGNKIRVHAVRETTYGQAAGLWGINCSHQPDTFIPGWSESERPVNPAVSEKRYNETQKQRYHEREVKNWKRSAVAADATGDKSAFAHASAKVKEKQAALREYCNRVGLPYDSNRIQVYGYNRSISSKATQAVRRAS